MQVTGEFNRFHVRDETQIYATVYHGRDKICKTQAEAKAVAEMLKGFFEAKIAGDERTMGEPVKQLLPEVQDEISKWLQWRIDRRKALLEVATQIFAMYSDAKDLPSLAALSSPEKRHYIQHAVNAAATLIDEIEAKVNMDEKIKTSAGK